MSITIRQTRSPWSPSIYSLGAVTLGYNSVRDINAVTRCFWILVLLNTTMSRKWAVWSGPMVSLWALFNCTFLLCMQNSLSLSLRAMLVSRIFTVLDYCWRSEYDIVSLRLTTGNKPESWIESWWPNDALIHCAFLVWHRLAYTSWEIPSSQWHYHTWWNWNKDYQ